MAHDQCVYGMPQVALNPRNTVHDAKRLIGRKYHDPQVTTLPLHNMWH